MAHGAVKQRALAVQRLVLQPGKRHGVRHHADVHAAVEHPLLHLAGRRHADIDHHVRPALLQARQRMGDAHVRQGHQVVGEADVQLATQVLVQAVDLGAEGFQRRQQLHGRLVHLAAFLGQGEAGSPALAQAQAEALFQVAHLLADGRAADAQHALGSGEAAALHHAAEDAQQANVEIADLRQGFGAAAAHGLVIPDLKIIKVGFS
ncbi:hypothetical protein D9M71_565460 [compost metagenome]